MGLCVGAGNGNAPKVVVWTIASSNVFMKIGVFKDWIEIHDERLISTFWGSFLNSE
jgi:hypothetical protein